MADGKVLIEVQMEDGSVAKGVANINDQLESAGKTSEGFGGRIKNALSLGAIGGAAFQAVQKVAQGIMSLSGEVLESSDAIDKFRSTMTAAGENSATIDKLTKSSQDYANKTVYDLKTVLNTTAQLGANGVKNYGQLVQAAGNMNAVFGGTADTFQSVAMVMTQTAGAGKLTTENWNQLSDAIPGASGKLQEAMKKNGAFTGNFRDAMAAGQITADEFNKAIMQLGMTDAAKQAAESTQTFEGAWGNLQASFVTVGTNFVNKVKKPITDAMAGIANAVPVAADSISNFFGQIAKAGQRSGIFSALQTQITNFDWSGMFAPMQKAWKDAQKGVGDLDFSGITLAVESIIPQFNSIGTALSESFAPVVSGITAMFGNLSNALQPLFTSFVNLNFTGMLAPLQSIGTTLQTVLSGLDFSGIKALAAQILPALEAGFTTFIGIAGPAISGVITAFGNLWNALQPVVTAIASMLLPAFKILGAYLGGMLKGFLDMVSLAFNGLAVVAKVLTPVIQFVANVFKALGPVLTAVAGWLGNIRGSFTATKGIVNVFKTAFGTATSFIKSAFSSMWGNLRSIFSSLRSAFGSVGSWFVSIGNKIGGVAKSIVGWFSGIGSKITRGFGNVVGSISSKFNGVVGAIKGKFGDVASIGLNVVKGIGRGITSGYSWIKGVISSFVGNTVSFIKKLFGIHSPSTVMREQVGRFLPAGIGVGIDKYSDYATDAMSSMTQKLSAMVPEATVQLGTSASLSGARSIVAGQYQAATNAVTDPVSGGDTDTGDLVINVAANIDGKRAVDKLAEPIRVKLSNIDRRNSRVKGVRV